MSTVYAVATARGKAGLGVVRLSGPRAWSSADALCGPLPPERHAGLRTLRAPDGTVLDRGLVLCFGDGASYTGEPVVELHCHGAPAILRAVLDTLAAQEGVRPAEPGEFTRRALANGRMDLAQVEGLADLLEAETELQRSQAWRVFSGELRGIVDGWRSSLVHALALVEATIDFADEDVPQDVTPEVGRLIAGVRTEMEAQIAGLGISERIRDGFTVAIVGPPNVGKSTLINRLAGRDLAIVSQFPGTTRDVIEVMLDLKGLPVTFLDTAGLRVGGDEVERIGIRHAKERAAAADLRVVLLNEAQDEPALPVMPGDIVLPAKADLRSASDGVSGLTGHGVEALLGRVYADLSQRAAASTAFTRHRHRLALSDASTALEAIQLKSGALELTSERLWEALRALASILGQVDVENVLDDVFASFCVGK